MLWACIKLPQLALDGVLRSRPTQEPLVLVDGPAHARFIVGANVAARKAGLRVKQRLTVAQTLLTQFEVVSYDHAAAMYWQRFLANVAYGYSSQVGLLSHAISLEISRSQHLFGSWSAIEHRLRRDLMALGFGHRISVAPTPHAAYVLADICDGQVVLTRQALQQALADVPLQKSSLPPPAADTLLRMGIRCLGPLLHMPRDGLRRRFGVGLLQSIDRLLGDLPPDIEPYLPPDRVDWRIEFSYDVENMAALMFPLKRLTQDLAVYLATRDAGVQRFVLRLEQRNSISTEITIGLLTPERDANLLFDAARGRLEQQRLSAPVQTLRLIAQNLPDLVPNGRDLFDQRPANTLSFAQLRERLRARLGDQSVYQWSSSTDPRPEYSQSRYEQNDAMCEVRTRPTWLLAQPIALRGPLRILAGPERLETGWWDDDKTRRDYYIVETALGQRAWAFCSVGKQTDWMLHGWFA